MNRISTVVVGSDPVLVGEQILIDSCSSSSEFYFDVWESHLYAYEKSNDGSAWSSYNERVPIMKGQVRGLISISMKVLVLIG